jgi:hypothetical protein
MKRFLAILPVFFVIVACSKDSDEAGKKTNNSFVNQVVKTQSVQDNVTLLYQIILDRQPDTGGYNFWTGELTAGGLQITAVMNAFINSPEFHNLAYGKSDTDFLNYTYLKALNRAPDSGGFDFWRGQLNGGVYTREQIFAMFLQSPEFKNAHPELFQVAPTPPTIPQPTGGACTTKAEFNNTFVTTGQKFVYKLYPGQSAATAFNSQNFTNIAVSTSDTVSSPASADNQITISKCPGDFSKVYPCAQNFLYVGGYVAASTEANPASYKCKLEPNTTYYMNVRQVVKGTNTPSCDLGEGCEVRVQIQGYEN